MDKAQEIFDGISLLNASGDERVTKITEALSQLLHIKTAIKFTDDIESIDDAVKFLIDTDAVICSPGNLPYANGQKNPDFVFIADAENIYSVLQNSKTKNIDKIRLFDYSLKHTEHFSKMHHSAKNDNQLVLEDFPLMRDKINFIYSLAANDINTVSQDPWVKLSYKIFTKFILTKIKDIESQSDPELQNQMIDNLMNHTIILDKTLKEKHDSFFEDLGKPRQTIPATCKVLLSDCTYADLFGLNKDKHYKIMHSIDASKFKQDFDFSNFDINGDFICVNQKRGNIIFPDTVNGTFDLTGCKFTFNRISNGAINVNLSHTTIKNFIDLQKINFPDTVTELILDTAIIKNILKLLENKNDTDPEIIAYKNFVQKYPKIQIVNHNRKLILQHELANISTVAPHTIKKEVVQNAISSVNIVVPSKTDEWLAPEELKDKLLTLYPELESVDDLDRLIKRARNLNSKVQKSTMKYNDIQVVCVHKNSVQQVMENIRDIESKTPKHIMPVQKKQSVEKTEQKQATVKKLKGIKYKKHMPASVYKQIKSACGDSMQLFISVLERISMINTNYSTTQNNIPLQYIDKDGQIHNIPNTTHKLYKAATTSITSLDNRRIVLTINPDDKIIVATAFFADHVNNIKNDKKYNDIAIPNAASGLLMDGKTPVTRDLIKSGDFIDVDAKLKELKGKDNVVVKTTEVIETKTITTTTVITETVKQHRPRKRINAGYVDVKLTANILENAITEIYAQLDRISKTTKIQGTKKDLRLAALEIVKHRLENEM